VSGFSPVFPASPTHTRSYIDILCPYSAKIFRSLTDNVIPLVSQGGKYAGKLSVVTWIYPQSL
jgi:hypothetical protein